MLDSRGKYCYIWLYTNSTCTTTKKIAYHPHWTQEQWAATENIVSGIEYATIMTKETEIPLPVQIERALNSILLLYEVPENLRRSKIQKVLSMDYRALGRKMLADFRQYISEVNEQNLQNASAE